MESGGPLDFAQEQEESAKPHEDGPLAADADEFAEVEVEGP